MKTALIRSAVVAVVFAGFSASSIASYGHVSNTTVAVAGGPGTMPTPACGPHDPSHCGSDE